MKKGMTHPLTGRRLYIPRMSTGGARAMAAAFRSLGVDADVSPHSDDRTLALAGLCTTGEECLPQRITLGNFLKVIKSENFVPEKTAFFLPTSSGPCRFGQYAPLLKKILKEMGLMDVLVFSPTSSNGYNGIAANVIKFRRTAWRALVAADILRKLTLMYRPYERVKGYTDRIHEEGLDSVCGILADGSQSLKIQEKKLRESLEQARDRFQSIPLTQEPGSRPLIGLVGEIFIRLNSFSNQELIRKIEAHGGEVWIADISEWIWYTQLEEERKLKESDRTFSPAMASARIRRHIQSMDERALMAPFQTIFRNRRETDVQDVLRYSAPYLPANMALGEMTLNTGKTLAFYRSGCHGVVDASPFTCMNGIVTETVYPYVSLDLGGFPIRIFYFDGVPFDLDEDIEIFMEQAMAFRQKQKGKKAV